MNREVYVCVCVCVWIEGWIVETASKYLCVCEETKKRTVMKEVLPLNDV